MTDKNEGLKKINKKFQKIVEGFMQYDSDDKSWHFNHRESFNKNRYSVTKSGNIEELFMAEQTNIDFDLISECKELRTLSIIKSGLSEIPENLKKIPSLKILDLSENKIEDIQNSIIELVNIEQINLSSNLIKSFPDILTKLPNLSDIDLSNNFIETIPKSIKDLKKIRHLDLSRNKIKDLPEEFFHMQALESLDLQSNDISLIPASIAKLRRISSLLLSDNRLEKIPDELFLAKELQHLSITSNLIYEISGEIKKLKKLAFFQASDNHLEKVPSDLFSLKEIRYIDLSYNRLKSIPELAEDIRHSKLELLRIEHNELTSIPNSLSFFTSLHLIDLEDNQLPIPDPSFHELTPSEQIQSLLLIQSSPLLPLKQAKILVVGDERVGKTSVINRLLGNLHNENQTSTQGIDISELDIGEFHVNIWDFAGQELTHQTHQFFLTERSLYLYVLDAQKEDNQARDLHWLSTIKSYSKDSPIIVVANHCDQNINYTFDIERYQEEFNIVEVIHTSACNLNTLNTEVKAALGDSIGGLYELIKNELPSLPGIERELPLSWHNVKESLEKLKKTSNVIEKDFFDKECEKEGINAKPLQDALLKILNSIGTVVAYPNDFRLRLTQILKPQWVTNAVYKIIRSSSGTQGVYSEEVVGKILCNDYTHSHQQWLIDLLIKFELGFRLPENQDLLIPMKLQTAMPAYDKTKYQKGLNIRFNYHRRGLLKQNVMPQLIVRMHNYIDDNTSKYWRHGMFVKLNDSQGVIIADEPNQCIDVYLSNRSDDSRTLLSWIRSNLAKIESAQTKATKDATLPYIEQIALFDESNSNIIGHADYQRIERANKQDKSTINLEIKDPLTGLMDDRDFNVQELLGLYKVSESNEFKPGKFVSFLRDTLLRLTDTRQKIIHETEDDTNDRLRESLRAGGYLVADQSRGGLSGSSKSAGERDLVVLNEFGQQACIIEAMVLNGFNKNTINEHYAKLSENYNTHGNPIDFLITYGKVKSIDNLWKSYRSLFPDFEDHTAQYTDKNSLRLGLTYIEDQDSQTKRRIIHMIINFGISN